nr:retrovirus-related Pol polyprotein from transposon TNT 1-94 [Tanacetum cinerariifolium]
DVWVLVELPPIARTVGSKWLFKKKTDMDGAVYIFKARLVAKGFTQTYGVDCEETFSPIADIRSIRILIAIAAYYDYEIWQMDFKTDFLNGHLFEEVYMEKPEGFVNPKYPNHVCKLKRSIYGLKQASRIWVKNTRLLLKIFLSIIAILRICFWYMETRYVFVLNGGAVDWKSTKQSIFPTSSTDAEYIAAFDASKEDNPGEEHWTAVKNILKYLRNNKDIFLVYGGNMKQEFRVSCYTDAGYLTDADNLKSQTGYVFVLNGGAVDWKSTKQSIFATSSTDAEYIAAFDASKDAVWTRKFFFGLGIVPTIEEPISMYCDNTRAIAISKDDGVTKDARHFRAKVHYLRETIKLGDVKIKKIDTDNNLADLFTKALAISKHSELTKNIRLLPASSFM